MGDVDLTLRHLATQHPADLVRVFVAGASALEAPRWLDSQLAARERRVDKAPPRSFSRALACCGPCSFPSRPTRRRRA